MKPTAALLLSGFLFIPAGLEAQASPMTLASVVRRVAAEDPGILAEKAAVDAARADTREVETDRLPKIYVSMDSGEGKNVNDLANVLLTGLSGATVSSPATRSRLADLSLNRPYFVPGARLEENLYDGGRTRAAIQAARAKTALTALAGEKTAQDQVYAAASYYLNLARAQALEKALADYSEVAARAAKALADQAAAGRITPAQAVGGEAKALDAKTAVDDNDDDMRLWSDLLRKVASLPASASFDTQELEAYLSSSKAAAMTGAADVAGNLDVKQAMLDTETQKLQLREAESRRLPQIKVVAQYGYQFSNLLFTFRPGYNAGVEVTYPLFTSGATGREIAAEQARLRAASLKERETRQATSSQYEQALEENGKIARELEAAATELEQAKEVYRVAQLKYEEGAGTATDLLEAAGMLLTARERCLDLARSSLLLYWQVLETQGKLEASLERGVLP